MFISNELTYVRRKKFPADVKHYYCHDLYLFKFCAEQIIRRYVPEEEIADILHHCHSREAGGNFSETQTTAKVLHQVLLSNLVMIFC